MTGIEQCLRCPPFFCVFFHFFGAILNHVSVRIYRITRFHPTGPSRCWSSGEEAAEAEEAEEAEEEEEEEEAEVALCYF